MARGVRQYVGVEFRGGPKDGDRAVVRWPPDPEVRFPAALGCISADEPTVPLSPLECHRYAATDMQQCEPFEVAEAALVAAHDSDLLLETLAARRAPFLYSWQGIE